MVWQPSETYPDPAIEVLDPRFRKYRITNAAVERRFTGMRWGEGPPFAPCSRPGTQAFTSDFNRSSIRIGRPRTRTPVA
jgi:hypothetical protein